MPSPTLVLDVDNTLGVALIGEVVPLISLLFTEPRV